MTTLLQKLPVNAALNTRSLLWLAAVGILVALLAGLTKVISDNPMASQDVRVMDWIVGWDLWGLTTYFEVVSFLTSTNAAFIYGPLGIIFLLLLGKTRPHPGNIYWYQALRANELFQALDGKQRKIALRSDPRRERRTEAVSVIGKKTGLHGIPLSEFSKDQKDLAWKVMTDVLAPFRKADVDECMNFIKAGGIDNLHMAYYKNMDIGEDGVWDVWQIEGPAMVWYFRGSPHVHTWVNIRQPEGHSTVRTARL